MVASIHWLPILPTGLIALIGVALVAALAFGSVVLLKKQVPARWVAILGGWRLLIVAVFVVALCQPVLSFTHPIEQRPELMVLVDLSKSMASPGSTSASRLSEVAPLLDSGELGRELRLRYRVHWFGFDSTAFPLERDGLARIQATGSTTHFDDSLAAAANLIRAQGGTPQHVLLVSDGNDLGQTDPVETARRLGLTVDTLGPAPTANPPAAAVRIADVQSARRVLLGSETHFRVALRSNDPRGNAGPVRLALTEDGKPVWSQDVRFKPDAGELRVPVAHRPTSAGIKHYEFRVGEGLPHQVSVQVVDAKNEVLVLEDAWRWDFKFLRRVFEDDPSFRFTAMLSRGGNTFVQFGAPDRRVNLVGFPQGRAELEGFDTIVLGDVNVKRWPRGLAPAIAEMVREEGRSLIVMAGPNLAQLAELREINALLPVDLTRESGIPVPGPVEVRVSEDGKSSPFFRESAEDEAALADAKLPPLDQIYPPLRKRPGATVLLEAARQANNSYGNLIVMAEHTVGRGRVLYIGTDTLWKWQTLGPENKAGVTPYRIFWQQALRALTPERPAAAGAQLWLQSMPTRSEVGRAITLQAEIQSDRPIAQPTVQATAIFPDDRRLPLTFAVDPADPAVLKAEFEPTRAGPHRIVASLVSGGRTEAETTSVIDVDPARGEDSDAGVDRANLERIATATGGRVVDPADPQTWPKPADGPRAVVDEAKTVDLWNNYTLMLLLCGMLAIDWILRLMRGYV
jgi:hypothetical protein